MTKDADWDAVSSTAEPVRVSALNLDEHNKGFYCLVAWLLGGSTISIIIGSFVLAYSAVEVPSALIAIGGVAVGALGNLFNR